MAERINRGSVFAPGGRLHCTVAHSWTSPATQCTRVTVPARSWCVIQPANSSHTTIRRRTRDGTQCVFPIESPRAVNEPSAAAPNRFHHSLTWVSCKYDEKCKRAFRRVGEVSRVETSPTQSERERSVTTKFRENENYVIIRSSWD